MINRLMREKLFALKPVDNSCWPERWTLFTSCLFRCYSWELLFISRVFHHTTHTWILNGFRKKEISNIGYIRRPHTRIFSMFSRIRWTTHIYSPYDGMVPSAIVRVFTCIRKPYFNKRMKWIQLREIILMEHSPG